MQIVIGLIVVLATSNYAGLTSRSIKALSDADVTALREGKGMGFALAAELNSYPGPKHVLELSDELELSAEQRVAVQQSHDRMAQRAIELGAEIIALEKKLDEAFASKSIDIARLETLTASIAERQGKLRQAHLLAHLETRRILTAAQIHAYDEARGYRASAENHQQHHHGHKH